MPKPIHSWKELWEREATELCQSLPGPLVGGAPIGISCYQPSDPEKLVYLGRKNSMPDPISMSVGVNARRIFFNAGLTAPWHAQRFTMTEGLAEEYRKTDKELRRRIYLAEDDRYRKTGEPLFDTENYHYRIGLEYLLQPVLASPLYHEHDYWWARLPRLGICWTIGDGLGAIGDGNSAEGREHKSPTEQLLLICGIGAGNRILAKRLNLLLSGYYRWAGEGAEDEYPEVGIARVLCTEKLNSTDYERWDRSVYLIVRLLIAHHMFFPQSPVALRTAAQLGVEPNEQMLVPYGWPRCHIDTESAAAGISQNLEYLVNDLMYLVSSLVRWEHPGETRRRTAAKDFKSTVEELTKVALALLCGSPVTGGKYAFIEPPTKLVEMGGFSIPLYEEGQIVADETAAAKLSASRTRIMQITPIVAKADPPSPPLYGIKHKAEVIFNSQASPSLTRSRPRDESRFEWISKFVRARFAGTSPGESPLV